MHTVAPLYIHTHIHDIHTYITYIGRGRLAALSRPNIKRLSSYYYTCVLMLLRMCSHTTTYVSSYYYIASYREGVIERLSAKHQTHLLPHAPCQCIWNCSLHRHAHAHTDTQTHPTQTHTHTHTTPRVQTSLSLPTKFQLGGGERVNIKHMCKKHLRGLDV